MSGKLTERQRLVLAEAARDPKYFGKGRFPSNHWRTFDQLERRGLLRRAIYGSYALTEAGRASLSKGNGNNE